MPLVSLTATDLKPPYRIPLLILGFISLGLGIGAGLVRLGWDFPLPRFELAFLHGALMICGFFGTVISLERAVAMQRLWSYSGPLCAGLGGGALIGGAAGLGGALLTVASLALLTGSIIIYRRQRALFTFTIALGAACWLIGNLLWLTNASLDSVTLWWTSFLVLTIAGERLELSRFVPTSPRAKQAFATAVAVLCLGIVVATVTPDSGRIIVSVAMLMLVLWLLRFDIARRTVKSTGLTRFIAVCLLSGYGWLAVGALFGLLPATSDIAARDAFLHAVLLGFVFSMVFGHAPIIFPAVTRFAIPYHPLFYVHLAALHLSLLVRIAGDLSNNPDLRSLGGALNAIAIVLFILNTIAAVVRGLRK